MQQQSTSSEERFERGPDWAPPLGTWLRRLLEGAALRETFRSLFGRELSGSSLGLPRWADATQLQAHLRSSDAWVELARSPRVEAFDAALVLTGEQATELVDLLLGGRGNASLAGPSGAPTAAECGVLAYGAARLCRSVGGWSVRDLRRAGEAEALPARSLLWPFTLRSSRGDLDLTLVLSAALAESLDETHALELVVRDRCTDATLHELAPGDVLTSDRWTLTHTSDGLSGDLLGVLAGSERQLSLRLTQGQLRGRGLIESAADHSLELVLARLPCRLVDLAELARGGVLSLHACDQPVLLRHAGRALASGELVVYRGAVGVRVTALLTRAS